MTEKGLPPAPTNNNYDYPRPKPTGNNFNKYNIHTSTKTEKEGKQHQELKYPPRETIFEPGLPPSPIYSVPRQPSRVIQKLVKVNYVTSPATITASKSVTELLSLHDTISVSGPSEPSLVAKSPDLAVYEQMFSVRPKHTLTRTEEKQKMFTRKKKGSFVKIGSNVLEFGGSIKSKLHNSCKKSVDSPDGLVHVPVHVLYPPLHQEPIPAFFIFLEGSIGVGKTTLLKSMRGILPGKNVLTFHEPMAFWKNVFSNSLDEVYKLTLPAKVGSMTNSSKLLACQLKFAAPLLALKTSTDRLSISNRSNLSSNMWVMFDRHPLSATVVFPYMHYQNGFLSFSHLVHLWGSFRASHGDNIILLNLNSQENLERVKRRNRKEEKCVSLEHIRMLNSCYHAVYCAWLLVQNFTPEEIVEVCFNTKQITDLRSSKPSFLEKHVSIEDVLKSSIFNAWMDMTKAYRDNCTLMECLLTLCKELEKVQLLHINASSFTDDIPGLWVSISTNIKRNSAVKPRRVNWLALEDLAHTFNSQ
ncbi:thymidine kinase [Ateline gammaherpesvirus 3]|uniref:Thymidine kinase n=1 Tax=Ateline herpesvirus 3 TaxID=85618 RepID=Q9YTP5_ATHV3|nr:thymidine kinase [Ateline gammaherpesvirus 3]AAC95545.1 thymidine kinase [Ateline gammaherpesvirus 3]